MRHIILAINAQGSYYLGYEGDVAHSVMTVTVILLIAWCYYSACNTNKVDVPIMRQPVLWIIHTNKCGSL